jgi:hypothetical protein
VEVVTREHRNRESRDLTLVCAVSAPRLDLTHRAIYSWINPASVAALKVSLEAIRRRAAST